MTVTPIALQHRFFKHSRVFTEMLNNISLAIPPHKFVALVGGSGAGKSTLMNALNGLQPAQQGKVLYKRQWPAPIDTHSASNLCWSRDCT